MEQLTFHFRVDRATFLAWDLDGEDLFNEHNLARLNASVGSVRRQQRLVSFADRGWTHMDKSVPSLTRAVTSRRVP